MPTLLFRPAAPSALWALSVLLALLLVYGLLAQSAEAESAGIVSGQSIDGIKLGESGKQVEQTLGTPTAGQISGGYLQYYPPSKFDGEVYFNAQGKVDGVLTSSSHFKTSKGIHVGSSFSAVHQAYPKATYEPTTYTPRYLTPRYTITSHYAGQTVLTVFHSIPGKQTVSGIEIDFQSALAASAKSPNTLIVVNEGIGLVHIGQTSKQVQQEVGKPTSKSTAMSWYYDNKAPYAQVGFGNSKRVTFISPNSARDKTSKGIGEGSSKAQVQAAYPDATCGPQPGPGGTTDLSCAITRHLPGGKTIATSFTFSTTDGSGGVNSVYISDF